MSFVLVCLVLHGGTSLLRRLERSTLGDTVIRKTAYRVNFALWIVLLCIFLRAAAFLFSIAMGERAKTWMANDAFVFLYFILNSMIPLNVTTLALLYLSRRILKQPVVADLYIEIDSTTRLQSRRLESLSSLNKVP